MFPPELQTYKSACLQSRPKHKKTKLLCGSTVKKFIKMDNLYITNIQDEEEEQQDDFLDLANAHQERYTNVANAVLEVVTFFHDAQTSLSRLANYPIIKKVILEYNKSLCSSAPVEMLFSLAGFIHSPKLVEI